MFADFMQRLRVQSQLKQREVADLLHVSEKTVSAWETGYCVPQPSLWVAIADIYGVTIMDIFEAMFSEASMIKFPHLVPAEEYRVAIMKSSFLSSQSVEDILRHHDAGNGYCWDYVLTLTRQEFEVCKYLMEAHTDMTIFDAYDAWILPRNIEAVRGRNHVHA